VAYPRGAAADPARDRVYVADTANDRVAVFELDGTWVANWFGVTAPQRVDVARNGNVFVSQLGGLIAMFTPEGVKTLDLPIQSRGDLGDEPHAGLAVGPDGLIYVAAPGGAVRFTEAGTNRGFVNGLEAARVTARDVAVDGDGFVSVLTGRSVIYRLLVGALIRSKTLGGHVMGVAGGVERETIYKVVEATRDQRAHVAKVTFRSGDLESERWGDPLTILGWLAAPLRLSAGPDGEVFSLDELYRVQRLTSSGSALGQVTLAGLRDVAVGPDGDLFVARERFGSSDEDESDPEVPPPGTHRLLVERLHFEGGLVSARNQPTRGAVVWSQSWTEDASTVDLSRIAAMAYDRARDRLWVLDAGRRQVLALGSDGRLLPPIALPDRAAGVPAYVDIAVAPDGALLVLHAADRLVLRYAPDGSLVDQWDTPEWAWRLDVTSGGQVALVTATRWLWVFDEHGSLAATVPLPASEHDQGEPPSDIAATTDGRLVVSDRSGSAIFVFAAGPGASQTPPPGSLDCAIDTTIDPEPRQALVGEVIHLSIALEGACEAHPRSRRLPDSLVTTGWVSVTLSSALAPLPGSVSSDGTVDGRTVTWTLEDLDHAGASFDLDVRATSQGRHAVIDSGGAAFRDGWLNTATTEIAPVYVIFRPGRSHVYLPDVRGRNRPGP
jgi:DNA-binding beta-propeller fold protein YncE